MALTTPKRPRTILAVEAELARKANATTITSANRASFKLDTAVALLADANREIEKLETENTLLKLQRARRRAGGSR